MVDFAERLRGYHIAKADLDRHQYGDYPEDNESQLAWDQETDRLSDAHTEAMDALMLTRANEKFEVVRKFEIIVSEQLHHNWHLSAPIMALAVDDLRRLIGGQ